MLKRTRRVLGRILENPKILIGKSKGLYTDHISCSLTAKDLVDKPFKTIIDIGANKGIFIDVSNWLFPEAKIYAFEPLPEMFEKIKNKKNVTAFNFGLWDKESTDTIYYNKKNIGASSFLKPTEKYKKEKAHGEENIVKRKAHKKRFDTLNIQIQRPCFVKMDVEGAEDKVIKGFGDQLKHVDVLQLEWFFRDYHEGQMKLGDVLPYLEKYGFVGFVQKELNFVHGIPSTCDLIFFKSKE